MGVGSNPSGISEDDRRFADQVVAEGRARPEQVEECLKAVSEMSLNGMLARLEDVMSQRGYLTTPPAERDVATLRVTPPSPSTAGPAREAGLPRDVAQAGEAEANRFGKFILISKIGEGGFGAVYRAWQKDLRRYVALKFLHSDNPADVDRFKREAQTSASLIHRHIIPIYEVGEREGKHYLAMEYIRGKTLDKLRLEPRPAAEAMRVVAEAVEHAHQHGIIHRDLKPQNLMMGDDGHVWVMDFGLARQLRSGNTLTVSGAVIGTPAFMPPEQALGKKCDERSDIYSLGATLYALLTGQAPFDGDNPLQILMRVAKSDPRSVRSLNPRIHPEVATILGKAMEKDPAKRYRMSKEFAEDLRRHLAGESILARPSSLAERGVKWVRRHPLASSITTVILVSVLALFTGGLFYIKNLTEARGIAEGERKKADAERLNAESERKTAELRLAESLVAQGDALGRSGRRWEAMSRYEESRTLLEKVGASTFLAELGMSDVYQSSPPPIATYRFHSGNVHCVAFLPDGRTAVSGASSGSLRHWEVQTGRTIRRTVAHEGGVNAVAVSQDGRLAISGGKDKLVKLWDLASGKELLRLSGHTATIYSVALSRDGTRALSGSNNGFRLWDLKAGRQIRRFQGHKQSTCGMAFKNDARHAWVASYDGQLKHWDLETGSEVRSITHAGGSCMALSADERWVLTGGWDRMVRLWDAKTGEELRRFEGHRAVVKSVSFLPDQSRIVSSGDDGTVRIWSLKTGEPLKTLSWHRSEVNQTALSPDGRFALSASDDGSIMLWDIDVARPLPAVLPNGDAQSAAFSPDGRLILTGGRRVKLWDAETRLQLRDSDLHVNQVSFSPDGRRALFGSDDSRVRLWDLEDWREIRRIEGHSKVVRSVRFLPDGKRALSAGWDTTVKVWDTETGAELRSLTGHKSWIEDLAPMPDGRTLLSGGRDALKLWDADSGALLRTIDSSPVILCMALSTDGQLALTGSDHKVTVWDIPSEKEVVQLRGHTGFVFRVAVSADRRYALSGSEDQTVRLWDLASGRELRCFEGHARDVWSVCFSPDGRLALSASHDNTLRFWDLSYWKRFNDLERRLTDARKSLTEDSSHGPFLAVVAEWYAFRGMWEWAIELYERARQAGALVSPLALGRCHWQNGNLAAARKEFLDALQKGGAPASYLKHCLQAVQPPGVDATYPDTLKPARSTGDSLKPGLVATGHGDDRLEAAVLRRIDPLIQFDWGLNAAWPRGPVDHFSLRWTGYLHLPKTGSYVVKVTSDDGIRLRLDGTEVLADWTSHARKSASIAIDAQAGYHELALEYFDDYSHALVELECRDAVSNAILGPDHYFHDPADFKPLPGQAPERK